MNIPTQAKTKTVSPHFSSTNIYGFGLKCQDVPIHKHLFCKCFKNWFQGECGWLWYAEDFWLGWGWPAALYRQVVGYGHWRYPYFSSSSKLSLVALYQQVVEEGRTIHCLPTFPPRSNKISAAKEITQFTYQSIKNLFYLQIVSGRWGDSKCGWSRCWFPPHPGLLSHPHHVPMTKYPSLSSF